MHAIGTRGTLVTLVNKTLYLPDDEAATWDKARQLAGDRLSPIILSALKDFISRKEAEKAGFERIEVAFDDPDDNGRPKRKAFYGKWLFSPDEPYRVGIRCYSVAITAKDNLVFHSWDTIGARVEKFRIFTSFDEALNDSSVRYVALEALRKRGVPVEELDI